MSRALSSALAIALAVGALAAAPSAGAAPRPLNLRVLGGAESWHTLNDFRLSWETAWPGEPAPPVAAVHLLLRDSVGVPLAPGEMRFPQSWSSLEHVHLPNGPGRYIAELWLESPGQEIGPSASVPLLYDDVPPGPTQPLAPADWVTADGPTTIRLEHPPGPWPVSGIRGYAISVDGGSGSSPCERASSCKPVETDLAGGAGDDAIVLGRMPEGANYVRAVAVSGAGLRSHQVSTAIVRVDGHDPDVALSAPSGWANGPVRVVATATDSQSGMVADGPSGPYTAIAVDGAPPRTDPGATSAVVVSGEGVHRVSFFARDGAGNVGDAAPGKTAVRIDETPPHVAFANSQDPAMPERIEAAVADPLSGADTARGTIAVRPAGTRERFQPLPTSSSGGRLVAQWSSDDFPARSYEFRATAYDAAGNAADSERRANGSRMVLANPVKAPARVESGFGDSSLVWQRCVRANGGRRCHRQRIRAFEARPHERTVPYGHGTVYGGRVSTAAGPVAAGLPVEVVESFQAGANPGRRTTTTRTRADGTFAVRLGPGPNRRVEATFLGSRTLTRAAGDPVELRTQTGLRFRASAATARVGGAPIMFSGRVGGLGVPIPFQGRPIELQFRYPGSGWSEFRTVQTDASGRFRYPYIFSDDDSRGIRFQFRAFAPAQPGWPYDPGTSPPVFVTGR